MTYSEIESFNKSINIKELKEYRRMLRKNYRKKLLDFAINELNRI